MTRTKHTAKPLSCYPAPPPPLHSLIATLNGFIDPQSTSALFFTIPPEIRNRIFSFALYSYDDLSRPYPEDSYYSRPGYRYHQLISTALLATCRHIYTETHDLPVSQNEHVFWGFARHGPIRDTPNGHDDVRWYFHKLTVEQRAAVREVHLFASLQWLEYRFEIFCKLDTQPQHLKITVRHTDWWYWETNTPLAMNYQWADNLKHMRKLEMFDLELETMERDKDQMETIVENLAKMRLFLANSKELSTQGNRITRCRYLGQPVYNLGGENNNNIYYSQPDDLWVHIAGRPQKALHQIPYVVSMIRWTLPLRST